MSIFKYSKAIVAAAATVVATAVVVFQGGDAADIGGLTTSLVGAATTFLVYFVPNAE